MFNREDVKQTKHHPTRFRHARKCLAVGALALWQRLNGRYRLGPMSDEGGFSKESIRLEQTGERFSHELPKH